jgi:hypothetical protein
MTPRNCVKVSVAGRYTHHKRSIDVRQSDRQATDSVDFPTHHPSSRNITLRIKFKTKTCGVSIYIRTPIGDVQANGPPKSRPSCASQHSQAHYVASKCWEGNLRRDKEKEEGSARAEEDAGLLHISPKEIILHCTNAPLFSTPDFEIYIDRIPGQYLN